MDARLSMEATTRWVLQNSKQLGEDTIAHIGYPKQMAKGIKFLTYPLAMPPPSLASPLCLSRHHSSPPPPARHRRSLTAAASRSLSSPSLPYLSLSPPVAALSLILSLPPPLPRCLSPVVADKERRAGRGGGRRAACGLRWLPPSSPPRAGLAPPPSPTSIGSGAASGRRRKIRRRCARIWPPRGQIRIERRRARRIKEEASVPVEDVAQVLTGIVSRLSPASSPPLVCLSLWPPTLTSLPLLRRRYILYKYILNLHLYTLYIDSLYI